MTGSDATAGSGNRREALAALLASSALGLTTLGSPSTAARGNGNGKKRRKRKNRGQDDANNNGNNSGNSNGSGNGGAGGGANVTLGNNVGDTLPSVRMVETTTVFDGDGIFDAISKCPESYVPINGGFFTSVPEPILLTSVPRLDENAWLIEIDGAEQGHQITVTAICLAATVVVDGEEERSASKSQQASGRARNTKK